MKSSVRLSYKVSDIPYTHGVGALRMATFDERLRDVLPIQMVNTESATPQLLNEKCRCGLCSKRAPMALWDYGSGGCDAPGIDRQGGVHVTILVVAPHRR